MTSRQAQVSLADAFAREKLDWIIPDWTAPQRVCAFVTTRSGGVSAAPYATMNLGRHSRDDVAALAENQRRFERFLPAAPVPLEQVHGIIVATLADNTATPVVADAAVTRVPGVVCTIRSADCMPVLLADRAGNAVGIVHAGWRGLAAGVLEATIAALGVLGVQRDHLVAWLGPAIGPSVFEVGDDVRDAFLCSSNAASNCFVAHRPGKWRADLYALARQHLARSGIANVSGGNFCTYSDAERFFSYRRERETGRMAASVWLR